MTVPTRKPTGLPSWPILLLAGREKAGKSWAAVSASASPLVGRTLYIGIGEDDPDEYALIPGADFEIVLHDGTFPGILQAVREAVAEPPVDGKPTLIILDSATRLWNLIGDNMQAIANRRAKGKKNAAGDFTISTDLWNVAAGQWQDIMDAIRVHQGPAIITARLDSVTVMENGQPTTAKEWKVQAHKSLVFDATAVIEMRERGQFLITGVKSARVQLDRPKSFPDFTVDTLWSRLGLSEGTAVRTHATVRADRSGAEPGAQGQSRAVEPGPQVDHAAAAVETARAAVVRVPKKNWLEPINAAKSRAQLRPIYQEVEAAGDLDVAIADGRSLKEYLWAVREGLPERAPATRTEAQSAPAEDAWAPTGEAEPVNEWPTATIPNDEKEVA